MSEDPSDLLRDMVDAANYCSVHGVEPIPEPCYRVCFECGHAYPTADDVRKAYRVEVNRSLLDYVPPADEIYSCPYCTHDW